MNQEHFIDQMTLADIRSAYGRNELTKAGYFIRMQAEHARLADYARFLKNTDIASIAITDDSVVFETRQHGVKIQCDPADRGIPPIVALNLGAYESVDGAMLMRLVDGGMTFFDIGANLGWYGLHVAKIFPSTKVFAFEPVAKTFSYLERNIAINGLTNMRAFPFGISSEAGESVFYVNPTIMGAASSSEMSSGNGEPQICKLRTLDEVVDMLRVHVDFIKADVEGAELFVFQGGLRTIAESKPVIFAEMLRKHAGTFQYCPNDIIKLLSTLGYQCYVCRGEGLVRFLRMDEQTAETNFVFLHPVKHATKIGKLTHEN